MISVTKMQQGEVGEIKSLVPHNRPSSQYKIQTAAFRLGAKCSLRPKSVASLETQYIITLLSGWGLVIPFFSFVFSFFIIIFYPALRMGSSKTCFFCCCCCCFFLIIIIILFFLVVTCPRPPVFAQPNKYSSCLSLHRLELVS